MVRKDPRIDLRKLGAVKDNMVLTEKWLSVKPIQIEETLFSKSQTVSKS